MTTDRATGWIRVLLAAAALAGVAACNDSGGPDQEPALIDIAHIGADYAASAVHAADLYTMTMLGLLADGSGSPRGSARLSAPGDTLLPGILTCPAVTVRAVAGTSLELRFDYGDGCATSFDGVTASGEIAVVVSRPAGGFELSCDFDTFVRGSRTLNGTLLAEGKLDTIAVNLAGLAYTGPEGSLLAVGALEFTRTTVLPAGGALCVGWSAENGMVTVETTKATWQIEIIEPVAVTSCCPWPTAGSVQVSAGGFFPAKIDFGDGTCDDLATITIAGTSETVSLSGLAFD